MPNIKEFLTLKRNKKREGTTTYSRPDERPVNANATTIVQKKNEEVKRVEETDKTVDEAAGKKKDSDGVNPGPTEKPAEPSRVNEDKGKQPQIEKDKDVSDETLAYFNVSSQYTMTQVVYTKHSEYVPNSMPMFIILDEALRLMGTSSHLSKYYSNFNPYAVKVGFAYCYYFQIIRSKLNAGVFDGREPSMISRFTKAIPFDTIKIPNILFPFFRTITATKFTDAKYDWIVPSFGTVDHDLPYQYHLDRNGRYEFTARNGLEYSCPNIPAMMMILSSFGAETQQSLGPKMRDGVYYPFNTTELAQNRATTGFNLPDNAFDFDDAAADVGNENSYHIFRTSGASSRFRFWSDDEQLARRHMADSSFYGRGKPAVYATARPAGSTAPQPNFREINDIEQFLFLSKDYNPAFFGYILEQMLIFCKFWKADHTLEQVPTTGGLLTVINAHLRFIEPLPATARAAADHYLYADRRCGLEHPNQVTWYPTLFDGLTANFTTSRGGITRLDELYAFTFGTNSIPPIASIQAGNAVRNFRNGKFFVEDTEQAIRYRLGDPNITDHEGYKPMYDGWTSEVLSKFFEPRPN